jgi:transposase
VHKKTVVACLLVSNANGGRQKQTRTFSTMTADLLVMVDWLQQGGCTHVAMESTGVYWQPIYNLLEGLFTVLVVNAQHIKAVPGRKTDVLDAERWRGGCALLKTTFPVWIRSLGLTVE